jgi:DNA-binding transcriptional LysR family regulator
MDQLDLLRLFVAIAEDGSLSAAARSRAISASTVTTGLQRLEERVGARLITRTTRRLSLTPEGERFLADCRRILSEIDEAMDNVAERGPLTGRLRVTATNDFGRRRVAPLVGEFMAMHAAVQMELLLTDTVIDLVETGFDIGLRTGPLQDSRLHARVLLRGTRSICASPAYWDRAGRPRHPRDLAKHNCLVLTRPDAPLSNWRFHEDGRPVVVKVQGDRSANDGESLRQWAIAGAGVILKASWDIAEDVARGRLETGLDEFATEAMHLHAVYSAGRHTSRRVAAFLDFLAPRLQNRLPTHS